MTTIVLTLGIGRCGTRTIANLFATLPGVRSYHECQPGLCSAAAARMTQTNYPVARDLHNNRVAGMAGVANFHEASMWWTWLIPDAVRQFERVKFIWLTRNVFEWARSAWRRGWYNPQVEHLRDCMVLLRPSPQNGWHIADTQWFKLGYMWQVYYQHTLSELTNSHAPWIQVNTSDLNNLEKVNALVTWCGFPGRVKSTQRANAGDAYVTCREVRKTHPNFGQQADDNMLDVPLTVNELVAEGYLPTAVKLAQQANLFRKLSPTAISDLTNGVKYAKETWRNIGRRFCGFSLSPRKR